MLLRHRPPDRGDVARRMRYCTHRPLFSRKGSPARQAGLVLSTTTVPRDTFTAMMYAWFIGLTNPALHETTNRNGAWSPSCRWVPSPWRSLVASEPTPFSRTVAFGPTEVPGEMALVEKATSQSDLYQVYFAFE